MKLLQKYQKYWRLWDGQITRADLRMTSLRVGESVPIFAQIGLLGVASREPTRPGLYRAEPAIIVDNAHSACFVR